MSRRRRALFLACLAFCAAPPAAQAAADPPDPGQTTSGTVASDGTEYQYLYVALVESQVINDRAGLLRYLRRAKL